MFGKELSSQGKILSFSYFLYSKNSPSLFKCHIRCPFLESFSALRDRVRSPSDGLFCTLVLTIVHFILYS